MRLRSVNDVLAGGFLILVALVGEWAAAELRVGTAVRMGPGYFPQALGWILLGFGVLLTLRGLLVEEPAEPWALRPLLLIPASVAAFGYALERFGLVAAVLALVVVARIGGRDGRPLETVLLGAGLAAFCVVVFVRLLGMAPPVWPWSV
jgi:hypothetical protein